MASSFGNNVTDDRELERLLWSLNSQRMTRSLPLLYFVSVVMFVGTVGNILVVITYQRRLKKSSTNYFIFCLALFNLTNCCFGLPMEVFYITHLYLYDYPAMCKIHKMVAFSADLAAGSTIICISFDRYFRITRPHHGFSRRRAKQLILTVALFSTLLSSPSLYVYGTEKILIGKHPTIQATRCGYADYAKSTVGPLLFNIILLTCFISGMGILFTVYIKLGIRIKRWGKRRSQPSSEKRKSSFEPASEDFSSRDTSEIPAKRTGQSEENFSSNSDILTDPSKVFKNGSACWMEKSNSLPLNGMKQTNTDLKVPVVLRSKTLPRSQIKKLEETIGRLAIAKRRSSIPSVPNFRKRMKVPKTTVMFIVATVAFISCHMPYIGLKIANIFDKSLSENLSSAVFVLYEIAEFSFVISYAINPLIYSFLNPKFRKECADLFISLKRKIWKKHSGSFDFSARSTEVNCKVTPLTIVIS